MNYINRHGRQIEVETVISGPISATSKKRKPFEPEWVKVPVPWIKALKQSKSASTYQLALAILVEAFRCKYFGHHEIVLSSAVTGMPRCTKVRAARKLAELGLIKIKQDGKEALRVSLVTK